MLGGCGRPGDASCRYTGFREIVAGGAGEMPRLVRRVVGKLIGGGVELW